MAILITSPGLVTTGTEGADDIRLNGGLTGTVPSLRLSLETTPSQSMVMVVSSLLLAAKSLVPLLRAKVVLTSSPFPASQELALRQTLRSTATQVVTPSHWMVYSELSMGVTATTLSPSAAAPTAP